MGFFYAMKLHEDNKEVTTRISKQRRCVRANARQRAPALREPKITPLLLVEAEVVEHLWRQIDLKVLSQSEIPWRNGYLRTIIEFLASHDECRREFQRWHDTTTLDSGTDFSLWMRRPYVNQFLEIN